jgi:hypothetical protein
MFNLPQFYENLKQRSEMVVCAWTPEPGQHRYQWVPVWSVFNSLFCSLDK